MIAKHVAVLALKNDIRHWFVDEERNDIPRTRRQRNRAHLLDHHRAAFLFVFEIEQKPPSPQFKLPVTFADRDQ